jgi:putative transposase
MNKTIYKSYKYRLYPSPEDKELLSLHFGHCRFVYNYFLKEKQEFYLKNKKTLNYNNCSQALTTLKKQKEYVWLKDVNSQSLQQSLKNLETAFGKFFSKKSKFPKFKRKDGNNSFNVPQNVAIKNDKIYIPKFKNGIKFVNHRPLKGKICSATISKKPSGKYYVSILTEQNVCIPDAADLTKAVGIDLGIKDFAITSDGKRYPNLKFQKKYQSKLSKLQKHFSKKQKGSNRKEKLRIKIAKLHEKITNSREDMQHKLSTLLLNKYDVICLETLAVKNMMQNHKLAYAIADVSWNSMIQKLEYKAAWKGKKIIKIDHFYPSSKTCHNCGYINQSLTLKDRFWVCPQCGTVLDRDVNAAKNILTRGLTILSSATDDYRHGAEIRLDKPTKDLTSISNEVSKIDLNI